MLLALSLDPHGWVDVTTLSNALVGHGHLITRKDLDPVVQTKVLRQYLPRERRRRRHPGSGVAALVKTSLGQDRWSQATS